MTAPERTWTDEQVTEQLVVHHEAAHVAMCLLYEIPFDHVKILTGFWSGRPNGGGYVATKGDADTTQIDNEIVMMFAGLAAEEIWLDRHPGHGIVNADNGAGDTAMARALIQAHDTSTEAWLRRRAAALVDSRWEHIEKIAAELLKRRRLTAAAARRAGK